jgi:hypothetical protein
MNILKSIFSFIYGSENKTLTNRQIEKEAIRRAFETGNAVIAHRNEDGSVDWREIEIKK